jgi:ATP-dependent Lon protease
VGDRRKIDSAAKGREGDSAEPVHPITFPPELPVLPAKDLVAFPSVMMAIFVERSSGIKAVEGAMAGDRLVFVATQKNGDIDEPSGRDLYKVGVVAHIIRMLKLSDERYKVLIQGIARARARRYRRDDIMIAMIDVLHDRPDPTGPTPEEEVIISRVRQNLQLLVEREHLPEELLLVTEDTNDPGNLSDVILAHYRIDIAAAQHALEELDVGKRLRLTDKIITDDLNQFFVSENIRDRARDQLNRGQREYYLREQIKQIREELGESDEGVENIEALKGALAAASLPAAAEAEAAKQLSRLERIPPESSEYALLRTYLEWVVDLPWNKRTRDKVNLAEAKQVLDRDHYGLEKAKDRIL